MGALVFTCPSHGQDIVSGIRTDALSLSQVRELPVTLFCPHCGVVHWFTAKDGRLAEAGPHAEHVVAARPRGTAMTR
jgi:hypothetical protein